ncbi:MAG TPA: putative transporter [Verrucomicrobia bacterium]|nr:putative transporter [Verrucomicrobiota bacterium]HOP98490.1 putative transporter [Verrucomicrobiota bacterium]HPU56126.1 putative transporter [Verrucomicrobiota bacterium]
MNWLQQMHSAQPVAWAVLVLMLVAVGGLALASIRIKGVGIGIAGVLFAGILAGHFGMRIEEEILEFVREFGLILFVFTIGLQLGPGFFASFRQQGLKLNLMAASIVVMGACIAVAVSFLARVDFAAALGLFSGATTNTPSLGASQQMLRALPTEWASQAAMPALAYAVAYPGGVFGIIGVLLLLRGVFRINPEQEAEQFRAEQRKNVAPLERMNLVVENANLEGLPLSEVPGRDAGVVVSRIRRAGATEVETATEQTRLHRGDILLAVGTRRALERFRVVIGRETDVNLVKAPGRVVSRKFVVTHKEVLGKTIDELDLDDLYGVTVTRVTRADIEMTAGPALRLQFGDMLQVVGDEKAMPKVARVLGDCVQALNETNFIPIFIGIALGVLVGTLPFTIPNMPVPVRLGIAGGPLILAIILSRIGRIGPLLWYMPVNANLAFRELGIVLFLACVGLRAGEKFFSTVLTNEGLYWLLGGLAITVIPILIVGLLARVVFRMNFTVIAGLLSGSMTDPPALAFANAITRSDLPSVAYATVYPLTMLLRIVAVQVLVLVFCR